MGSNAVEGVVYVRIVKYTDTQVSTLIQLLGLVLSTL